MILERRGGALLSSLQKPRPSVVAYVEITTDPDDIASRRVIDVNGGIDGHFTRPKQFGSKRGLRFRITLM